MSRGIPRLRLWPRSLGAQLVLLLLAALVAAQAATTLVFLQSRRSAVEAVAREQVVGRTAALVRLLEDTPPDLQQRIVAAAGSARLVYSLDVEPVVRDGAVPPGDAEAFAALAALFDGRPVRFDVGDREWRPRFRDRMADRRGGGDDDDRPGRFGDARRAARLVGPVVAMSIGLSDGRWLNAETLLPDPVLFAWPAMLSTLITAGAIVVVAGVSVRRITRPLRRLADAADRLGRGDTVPDLPDEGAEEVRRTTRAFNAMQGRVRRFVDDRTRMLAAMSHDLRTPLTALRLRAEFIDDDEIRDKIIGSVDEMSRMAEATLAFARDDARAEDSRPTDLSSLTRAVADDFSDIGDDVTVDAPEKLEHVVRPVALRRAVRNLVENAVRYGARARIRLAREGGEIVIAVDDDGPGIPADKLEEVFEPFTRLETSRSLETGGVGLGLSTARSIARAHGGDLTLENRPGGGLTATIRLPA
jgi:signal transduction histidine kinase